MSEIAGQFTKMDFAPKVINRMTYLLSVHHEQPGENPRTTQATYQRHLEHEEECYTRRLTLGDEPQRIETGWLEEEKCGMVLVENLEGKHTVVNPTEEEAKELADKVILIQCNGIPFCEVPPGFTQPLMPVNLSIMSLQSLVLGTSISYRVTVIPK